MWFLIVSLAFVLAAPFLLERARLPMDPETRRTATGEFVELSQGLTYYEWFGPQDGPRIVCIHGLTTPSFVYRSFAKALAALGYRVLTYDLYGRGFSDRPRGRQNDAFFLRQLSDLLADNRMGNDLTLIGYSMGGAIATSFAAKYPARMKQVILLAPAGMTMARGKMVDFMIKTPVLGDWIMLVFFPRKHREGTEAERHLPTSVNGIVDLQQTELRRRGFIPAVLSSLRGILRGSQEAEHKMIAQAGLPVHAIFGAEDDVIPEPAPSLLQSWNPNADVSVIPEAGHGLTYTHTDEVIAIVTEALIETPA
jgi:pimeloyl-ACP methyl ester carboxylesterase